MTNDIDRMIRIREVEQVTGLSHTTIYRMIGRGDFPAPIMVGKRAARWKLSEVMAYVDGCPRGAEGEAAAAA